MISFFCNSEVMTSFPHNLVLDSQPRFGFTLSEFLNLKNFLINQRTNGPVNAHLISGPTVSTKTSKIG